VKFRSGIMDVDDLESAINSAKDDVVVEEDASSDVSPQENKMSEDQEVGFHKGALNTLVAERSELVKMIGNIEAIMQAHISRLKELGVDIK